MHRTQIAEGPSKIAVRTPQVCLSPVSILRIKWKESSWQYSALSLSSHLPPSQSFWTVQMPTRWATCLLLPPLGLVRKEALPQLKRLNTPTRSSFALWHKFNTCTRPRRLLTNGCALFFSQGWSLQFWRFRKIQFRVLLWHGH